MKTVIIILVFCLNLNAQSITGKLVDQNGNGLSGLQLQLYINPKVYTTTSSSTGSFTFSNITDVKDEQLPTGYSVSDNYPNPFNPKTRIGITLPNSGSVRVDVYNLLGQRVIDDIERYFSAGDSYVDLELNGLPNGFYIAQITLDEKYVVTKKLMLLYGSQHLSSSSYSSSSFSRLNKSTLRNNSTLDTRIDSLVVTGISIVKKVFTNLPSMIGTSLNLGNLIIPLPVPETPTLASPVDGATDISISPTLYWNVSSTATSYTLQVSTSGSFTSFVFNKSGIINTNQQITGLSYFTKYYWRVNASKNNSVSSWSSSWSFNTIGTTPQTPTLLSPTNNATSISTSPSLTWNPSNFASSYTLQISTSSSFSNFVYNQSGLTNTSQQVVGLSNSTQYYWRVNATNIYGTSSWTNKWSFTTLITFPLAPTLSYPQDGTGNISLSPTLYWNIAEGAISYTLQVSTKEDFSILVINQSGLVNTNQSISGLSNLKQYYWRVSGTNNYGTSSWSYYWIFKTMSGPCPGKPTVTYEGKVYNTIQIGKQCWLKENLEVGTMVPGSQYQTNNSTIEKYCYNDDPNNCATYGGLYQWAEAVQYTNGATNSISPNPAFTSNVQGICPTGWHIPGLFEFQDLNSILSSDKIELNISGFSTLFAGYRDYYWSRFDQLGRQNNLWSTTPYDANYARNSTFGTLETKMYLLGKENKSDGASVRCIMD